MKLELERRRFSPKSTIGDLFINDRFQCFTLEDPVRAGPKVRGATAIPYGTYEVDITYSPRFGRDLPLVEKVPNFEGIRIHPGNTAADTEGCILVGTMAGIDILLNSKEAFRALFEKMHYAVENGEAIILEIREGTRA